MAIDEKALPAARGRDAQGPSAHLPRGQLLRRPASPGTPSAPEMEEGGDDPARKHGRAGPVRPGALGLRSGHAREPQDLRQGVLDGARQGRRRRRSTDSFKPAASALPQIALLSEAVRGPGPETCRSFIRDAGRTATALRRDATSCPSSSPVSTAPCAHSRRRQAEVSANAARPRLDARRGAPGARRAQPRLPADARTRARDPPGAARGARDAAAGEAGARQSSSGSSARPSCPR